MLRQVAQAAVLMLMAGRNAQAQPDPKQDNAQCLNAQTPGQCEAALPGCERVLGALAQFPANPELDAFHRRTLNKTAWCENQLGRYAPAEGHCRASLALDQRLHGPEHPDVASSLNNLAFVLSSQGKYEAAEKLYRQALEMTQKLLGAEHPSVATSLNNLAGVLESQGKYESAEKLNRQALEMMQKLLGAEHPSVATSLNNLAGVLERQGNYEAAEKLNRQALEMRQKLLGAEHPDVAASLNNLAFVLSRQGKYEAAEKLYRQALEMMQKLLGAEHPDVASSLNNLALVLDRQGKYEAAEKLYRQALEMMQKLLGAEHPDVASSLNNLAGVLESQGKYEAAEKLYRQALEMMQKLLGAEHPDVASSLNNLAGVLESQGKYEAVEKLYRQALEMSQKLLGAEHPSVASSLNNLALVLYRQGKYEAAEKLYRQALEMRQKLLGAEHPDVAISLNNLAVVLNRRGQFPSALPLYAKAAQIEESVLRATSSETRMKSALDQVRGSEDTLYGLLLEHPQDEQLKRLVLTTALLRKGRAAEAGTVANRLLHQSRSNPHTKQQFEAWQQVRQQRESLLYGSSGPLSPLEQRERLRALSEQADDLESQLAAAIPEIRELQPPKSEEILAAVAKRLPQDGVLFEVVRAMPFDFQAKGTESQWKAPHYLALVMTGNQQIVVQDLGEASVVDGKVQDLLHALRTPASDPVPSAKALYEQVLKRVLPELAKQVYLSVDGALSLIPFDALHDGTDYLQGRKTFHYLTSGRDVLRTDSTESKQAALVLADPDFGSAAKESQSGGEETFYRKLAGLSRLSGAQEEAKQIGPMLRVTPLVGKGAKESVVRATQAPWVLHIASHGLFLGGGALTRSGGRGGALFGSPFSERKGVFAGNIVSEPMEVYGGSESLSRSALVLADAAQGEKAKSAAEDGLLTAEEARSLDLFGTQLVVLSACDTGRGELSVGQGVYGLRRAFVVAGAETLVTSLWQVSDAATGKLMGKYYQKLLKEKKGRLQGMQEAMKEMREKYKHPYYWAPFLVIGSDGPLRPPANWSQR
jgi:tetratricopeptide (TPR) repeat protein